MLKVGDVVKLKSDSHWMTVNQVLGNGNVICVWYTNEEMKSYTLAAEALKKAGE